MSAVTMKYYSKSFKILAILSFAFVFGLLMNQVYFRVYLSKSQEDFTLRKNILSSAQLRTYSLALVQSVMRHIVALGTNRLSPADMGLIVRPVPTYITIATNYIKQLATYNKQLLLDANSLNEERRAFLYQEDVRMYDTFFDPTGKSFINMTSFHATTRIIETAFKEIALSKIDVNDSIPQFNYIYRNSLNDLYIKNNEISRVFFDSVQSQLGDIILITRIYWVVGTVLEFTMTFIVLFMLWKLFYSEKKNMTDFSKLDTLSIKLFLVKLKKFSNSVHDEVFFEEHNRKRMNDDETFVAKEVFQYSRSLNYTGLKRKYFIYSGRWILFMCFLSAIIIINTITANRSQKYFAKKIGELDLCYRLNSRININTIVATELPPGKGETMIQNEKTSVGIATAYRDMIELQSELWEYIMKGDLVDDPVIKSVLFDDACDFLIKNEATLDLFCSVAPILGVPRNIIQSLIIIEKVILDKKVLFEASDKTEQSLKAIESHDFDTLTTAKRFLTSGFTAIGLSIDAKLKDYITNFIRYRNLLVWISTIFYFVLVLLVWKFLLVHLKETHNNFKKVLQMLPGEIILSNHLLKNFLRKTSTENLRP